MDITAMLSEFRSELKTIEEAIMVLERLARGSGKRRGRPPKWMSVIRSKETRQDQERTAPKREISPEMRAKMAAGQKRRWAAFRASQNQPQ